MKIWLDDERQTPEGWVRVYWPTEAIELLELNEVETISLDHDLGDDDRGTGYDVLVYIEERSFNEPTYKVPNLLLHTMNPVARAKMQRTIDSINKRLAR